MGKQVVGTIKDIITSLLIIACVIIILTIIFYDKISLVKVISESKDYELSEKMSEDLKEEDLDDTKEIIVDYYIDAFDLKKYEKTNEYDEGRSNPFAQIEENMFTNSGNTSSNNSSGNFYQDGGMK